jgi:hypothetical protein
MIENAIAGSIAECTSVGEFLEKIRANPGKKKADRAEDGDDAAGRIVTDEGQASTSPEKRSAWLTQPHRRRRRRGRKP